MSTVAASLIRSEGLTPVLCDVGASAGPPEIWASIAHLSTYIGFDPDARATDEQQAHGFARSLMIPKAVVAESGHVEFFLTRSPYCSSTLRPDLGSLSSYLFSDLFEVEGRVTVEGTTLAQAAREAEVQTLDWIKLDTQGTDLRVFSSLPDDMRAAVVALDIEPGLIDAYEGEDLFIDAHQALTRDGFWLSRLEVHGAVRMSRPTRDHLITKGIPMGLLEEAVRVSPGWVGARYLRDQQTLQGMGERQRLLAWAFAMIDEQPGFALDVAAMLEESVGRRAADAALSVINRSRSWWRYRRIKRRAAGKVRSLIR